MNKMVAKLTALVMVMLLAGCGGGEEAFKGTPAAAAPGGGTGTATNVQMTLSVGVGTLSAGGSTSVTAVLTDAASGTPFTTDTGVIFTSGCSTALSASLTSPITTSGGSAISTYVAKGCDGVDTIAATATAGSGTVVATTTITVLPAVLGSIQFVSATPQSIALKGTGGAGLSENSTVVFKVLNSVGGVVPDRDVTFVLDTTVGGLSISPATARTDANGQAQTVVQSGTIPTPVRVTATIVGTSPAIATQSDQLVITTGIPTQRNISLSAETHNPEAWRIDGVVVKITARLADRFNNPVPDGTAVTFTAEGGSIGGSCTTSVGACTVNWISQNFRPSNGRVSILATVIGEESFVDNNGNGKFDNADTFAAANDFPEAFRDDNENGVYNVGEFFSDFTINNAYDVADGKFNGILCEHAFLCGTAKTVSVRDDLVLVMSDSFANIGISPSPIVNVSGGAQTVTITVGGFDHNQPMPKGTTIAISSSNGTLSGPTSYTVGNTNFNGPLGYSVGLASDGTTSTGTLTVTVTAPSGEKSYGTVGVMD